MSYPHPSNPPYDGQGGQSNPYPGGYGPAPGSDPGHAPGGQPSQGGWPAAPSGPQQGQQQYPSGPQQGYPQPYPSGPQQGHPQQYPPGPQQAAYQQPGQYQQQYAPQQPPTGGGDEKQMALFAHLGGIIGIIIPLILYLVKKDESPYIRHQSAQAFNFQLVMTIAHIVSGVLWFVLIGILTTFAVFVVQVIFAIMASTAAQRGEWYTYPFSIPALK